MISSTLTQSMQRMQYRDSSHSWLSIEQWRRAVALHFGSQSVADTADSPGAPPSKRKRHDYDTALPAMLSPPASDRSHSPSKRIKLSHRSRDSSRDDDDDPFLAGAADARPDPDSDQTPRRNTTADIISNAPQLTPRPPQSVASSASGASAASRTTTSTTTSCARSTSPTKMTQRLVALQKPIHHVQIDDN
ncbi:hypothetical protein GE09DRAFT_629138 [Coniochaeta sp. 2T2.1]|nr:hypothetical protein GE09DRAFT_629138 [Coniochaeta sp. 2T2.1]